MGNATSKTHFAIIATASAFGLTYGLAAPLIALELNERGVSGLLIGVNAAMHALGVLIIAPLLPRIVASAGLSRPAGAALVISALLLAAFPFAPFLWLWFVLRVLLGMTSESLFVISESWLSETTTEATRTRTMGVYVAAMSGGIALGPAVLSLAGRDGALPFLVGAGFAMLAFVILLVMRPQQLPLPPSEPRSFGAYLNMAPLAVGAAALNATVEAAGLTLLPIYALDLGWTETQGTLLLTVLLTGAILLQVPVGWLGDRVNKDLLISLLALIAGVGALLWPVAMSHAWLAWPLLFFWGGAFVGIYTLVLTLVGQRFRGAQLAGVFGVMSVGWGVGALVGPPLGGLAMHLGRHGLPFMVAIFCVAFAVACRLLPTRRSVGSL